jgi:outer membrane murein-binding lipoprotein Lpp
VLGTDLRVSLQTFDKNMNEETNLPEPIKAQAIDYVSSGAKAILGAVPFVGSLLSEIAGSIIPRQRVDRIADFAGKLEARINHLENDTVRSQLNDEEFTDLVEEALRQAARSTSEARRDYLASLVANSLSSDAIEHAESKHLMRILGELNDIEVLWLRFYQNPTIGGDQDFRELHKEVFERRIAYIGCSIEELDDYALQESYRDHLIELGLLSRNISKDRNGNPEFDRFSGDFKVSFHRTSALGALLLESIGMIKRETKRKKEVEQGGAANPLQPSTSGDC